MRKLCFLFTVLSISVYSQSNDVRSRSWTSFVQAIDITSDTEKKFKLTGSIKVEPEDKMASASLWARVDTKDGEVGFFDNMGDREVKINTWKEYTIEGKINSNSKTLNFGGLCSYNGKFYFDNLKLFVEDDNGAYQEMPIANGSFEKKVSNNTIENWFEAITINRTVRIKEFNFSSSKDASQGKYALLVKGKGIKLPEYELGKIGNDNAENPQIDNMIAMLEDLKNRVEGIVKNLPQEHIDHLHDPKANRIGSLVMHLAAAEVYYQKYTFGESVFEKKNPELWSAGLDLDEEGRALLQGKPISYYLDLFDEVREKTIEELRKKDDAWFKKSNVGNGMTNQYAWFHVMEHQSSHLGQILFLRKRLPELKKEVKINETIKK